MDYTNNISDWEVCNPMVLKYVKSPFCLDKTKTQKQIKSDKQRRNSLCACGSGLKFKKCCLNKE